MTSRLQASLASESPRSRLVLGAAQLGMSYGVVNKTGRPDLATARTMIRTLADRGVTVIDTAAAYGTSEEVVGAVLADDATLRRNTVVVTKLDPLQGADSWSDGELGQAAVRSIDRSLKALRMECLPLLLFHRPAHLSVRGGLLRATLQRQVDAGKVAAVGVSVYEPSEAEAALVMDEIAAFQLPANVFDHRFLAVGLIDRAAARGITVFARSSYLQGVVVTAPEHLPDRLAELREPVAQFRRCCATWGRSPADVALAFVRSFEQIHGIVVGMENVAQAQENAALFLTPALDEGQRDELLRLFAALPAHLINPSMWPA